MIDLHVHLDGSLSQEQLERLCALNHLPVTEIRRHRLHAKNCGSLNEYLECFEFPLSLLQSAEAIAYAVYSTFVGFAEKGYEYAELRFAPSLHMRHGLTQDQVVRAAISGLEAAKKETGMPGQLLLCLMRGAKKEDNHETVRVAREYLWKGVCGIDLAGAEGLYPNELYEEEFFFATGIPKTIHAGEDRGAESIWSAIRMGATRIGHGVRAAEDPELLTYLRVHDIALELCPTSEVDTGAIPSYEALPLPLFLEKGITVVICTDDMCVSSITLEEELEKVQKTFGLSEKAMKMLRLNAAYASFQSLEDKLALMKRIM